MAKKRGEEVRSFILDNVSQHPKDIVSVTSRSLFISRQAVHKHIKILISQKKIIAKGKNKGISYSLFLELDQNNCEWKKSFEINSSIAEDIVWRAEISSRLGDLPENVMAIWQHGFTEMFNNAIDHSEGSTISVTIIKTEFKTIVFVVDDGIGIFNKLKDSLGLVDERHAVTELTKGKLTTDPSRHSGEGIFFTSRMFDSYAIISGAVALIHKSESEEDWVFEQANIGTGTCVVLEIVNVSARTVKEVFDSYTDENYGFIKTVVPVRLSQYENDQLVSRSQAKRLLARVDRFKKVVFDFSGIESIGQAFSDEIFRVFANQHSGIEMVPIGANDSVLRMINHVKTKSEK